MLNSRLYTILYCLVVALILVPWAYYDQANITYSFLPRKILFGIMALVGVIIILTGKNISQKIIHGAVFGVLGLLHWKLNGYIEPHYAFQFVYLELALLILFAPSEIKQKFLKISHLVLYVFLAKAIFFRTGSYIHGGFYSSNTYATYIFYLCFIEVYKKRYWNLVPALFVMYFVGSKSVYIGLSMLLIFTVCSRWTSIKQHPLFARKKLFNSFYAPFLSTFVLIGIAALIMMGTNYYQSWAQAMEPQREAITRENMIMYGLDNSADAELKRKEVLVDIEKQLEGRELSEKPLISNIGISGGFRINQYIYMYSNLYNYFWVGDTTGSQSQMFGHNPHSAPIDFISRLGMLYLILVLIFYTRLFRSMNLVMLNACILPVIAFQPYGFTIGHSLVVLAFVYSLAKMAQEQNAFS